MFARFARCLKQIREYFLTGNILEDILNGRIFVLNFKLGGRKMIKYFGDYFERGSLKSSLEEENSGDRFKDNSSANWIEKGANSWIVSAVIYIIAAIARFFALFEGIFVKK